ncbi:MAG: TonB-dependent receptor [Proteobacteria bacterium]|nr:TonB-dependent receptor [Pseudomonadota bacterium]MBU1709253.1 TonB-dependent receptor [Pseudomonadota bacterium]
MNEKSLWKVFKPLIVIAFVLLLQPFGVSAAEQESPREGEDLLLYFSEFDLVEATTRAPKPVWQIPENVSIITAKQIKDMNAHTIDDVLRRVAGISSDDLRDDFIGVSPTIQGSEQRHMTVLLDGMRWSIPSSGTTMGTIPVEIVKRIEIIKGPASSTWGSALGGIINIITKDAGTSRSPSGNISWSEGSANTSDTRATMSGKGGNVSYYAYAGAKETDGLNNNRYYTEQTFLGKMNIDMGSDMSLKLTAGYGENYENYGNLEYSFLISHGIMRTDYVNANFDARLTDNLMLNVLLYSLNKKGVQNNDENGVYGPVGDLYFNGIFDSHSHGGSAIFNLDTGYLGTMVMGADIIHSEMDFTAESGDYLQSEDGGGADPVDEFSPTRDEVGVYINDTIVMGDFALTPGIRYDHASVFGGFASPSIGLTYSLSKTVFRASCSRGFSSPNLLETSSGSLFADPNPDLKPEKVTSYQVGFESSDPGFVWIKTTLFQHDLRNALDYINSPTNPDNYMAVNSGKARRQGFEVELETMQYYNLSVRASFDLVNVEDYEDGKNKEEYGSDIALRYVKDDIFSAQFLGNYRWYEEGLFAIPYSCDDMIWDFMLNSKGIFGKWQDVDFFFSVHNIANGTSTTTFDYVDPGRWFEGGIRFNY